MSAAAWLRGLATGALTATLAVAAHAVAGCGLPSGATTAVLLLLASTIGAVAFTTSAGACGLVAILSTGQLLGHLLLGAVGHSHSVHGGGPPATAMLVAHVVAAAIGALLIAAGEHLCAAVSRVVHAARSTAGQFACITTAFTTTTADQPMRSTLLLATSMSRRGPPVSLAL